MKKTSLTDKVSSMFSVRLSSSNTLFWGVSLTPKPAIFENLLGVSPELAEQIVDKTQFLKWLLERVQVGTHDENRGYASELLSILLQSSRSNRLVLAKEGGIEVLLQSLAVRQFPVCAP